MLCVWKFQLPDWISCRIFVMWWQNIWARRASELVKCLLLIFASDVVVAAAVVRGRRLLCPTACIAPCFWSVYLCGRVCVAISWDLPPSVGWLNLSECYLFFLPSLSGRLFFFCFFFYYYCILIPEQHFSRVFATVPGWGGTKGSAGVFSPSSHMCSSPAGWLECRFFFTAGENLKFVQLSETLQKMQEVTQMHSVFLLSASSTCLLLMPRIIQTSQSVYVLPGNVK